MTDQQIVIAIQSGDERGIESLIDQYENYIYTVVKNTMPHQPPDDIRECLNDIYIALWQNIQSYQSDKGSLKNWIVGVSKYKTIDYLRKQRMRQKSECLAYENSTDVSHEGVSDSYEKYYIEEESYQALIDHIMNQLNPKDQELFIMKYLHGASLEEISKALNLNMQNLYNHMSRLKNKLKIMEVTQ